MRGLEQFQTKAGFWMFIYLRHQIVRDPVPSELDNMLRWSQVTSCLQRNIRVPPILIKWAKENTERSTALSRVGSELADIVTDFCRVRSQLASGEITDPIVIFSMLSSIDMRLANWAAGVPAVWLYEIVHETQPSDEVYNGTYHIYKVSWMTHVWNSYRCVRILVNELLLGHLTPRSKLLSPFSTQDFGVQRLYLRDSMTQLSSDICSSLPFYFNHHKPHLRNSDTPPPPAAMGMYCVWPLFLSGSMVGATSSQRRWVSGRLRHIGLVMGIQQATAFANRLDEAIDTGPDVESPWKHGRPDGYWIQASSDDEDEDDKDTIEVDDQAHYEHDVDEVEPDDWRTYLGVVGKFGQFPEESNGDRRG
jgi:hypothetical protein